MGLWGREGAGGGGAVREIKNKTVLNFTFPEFLWMVIQGTHICFVLWSLELLLLIHIVTTVTSPPSHQS